MKQYWVVAALLLLYATSARADAPPSLVRVVILDTSGSMAGERLDTARKELLDVARQLPPSAACPFVIVPFDDAPHDVRTFTDLPPLEAYLDKARAQRGTSIASGLERALAELKPYAAAKHVCVLLYTDGEDGDAEGIRKQEEQLDRMFAARGQQGLRQTVVFCKRWEQANADLLARLTKSGNARVVDVGDLRLQPVTLNPSVAVVRASWCKDRPGVLDLEVAAKVDVKGQGSESLAALRFACRNAGAEGDVKTEAQPGAPAATAMKLKLPVLADAAAAGRIEVEFDVAQPADVKASGGLVLPLLVLDRLKTTVTLPPISMRCAVKVSAVPAGTATWADPILRRAAFPLTLTCDLQYVGDGPMLGPVHFRVVPDPGNHYVAGEESFSVASPGTKSVALTLNAAGDRPVVPVGFTLTPEGVPAWLAFDPPALHVLQQLAPPPVVRTTLTARVRSATAAQWTDLRRGTAALEADVEFKVDGPLASNTEVTLQCPPAVRGVRLNPARIGTGVQTVRLALEADLPPAPGCKTLVFQIVPPPLQGAVEVHAAGPLCLKAAGPASVQVALSYAGSVAPVWDISLADKDAAAVLPVEPVVFALERPGVARGLAVHVTSVLAAKGDDVGDLALSAPAELTLRLPDGEASPFFYDSVAEGDVIVLPSPPCPAVIGSTHHVVLRVEAPFKRLLFYLTAVVCALLAVYFLIRMYLRLTTSEMKR